MFFLYFWQGDKFFKMKTFLKFKFLLYIKFSIQGRVNRATLRLMYIRLKTEVLRRGIASSTKMLNKEEEKKPHRFMLKPFTLRVQGFISGVFGQRLIEVLGRGIVWPRRNC